MSAPSKIAVLVLSCNAPDILAAHIEKSCPEKFHFFIHIDKKSQCNFMTIADLHPNVTILDERFAVFWGGYNMVRATIALADRAMKEMHFKRYVLISDDSFPLIEMNRLHERISAGGDVIQCYRAQRGDLRSTRYSDYYFFDSNFSSARHVDAEKRHVTEHEIDAILRMQHLMTRGKRPIEIFSGSQWWILTHESLSLCLNLLHSDEWLSESFEFAAIPDEMAFQSIYCETQKMNNPDFRAPTQSPMHVDFSREPKPFVFKRKEDIVITANNSSFYIRKIVHDPELLAHILKIKGE